MEKKIFGLGIRRGEPKTQGVKIVQVAEIKTGPGQGTFQITHEADWLIPLAIDSVPQIVDAESGEVTVLDL